MPTPALLLLIATLLPLAAFVILLFIGKRMGTPLAGVLGTLAIGGSFVCSMIAMMVWLNPSGQYFDPSRQTMIEWGANKNPINLPYQWIPVGKGISQDHPNFLDVGIYVDSLTIVMFAMITLVSLLVHVFSIGYMRDDPKFARFFTYLGLFCFSMLGLVIGGTVLQLFIFWELVGLCSYLLIGFWYEKKAASNAAIKAFITNRVGDFGFLIGFGILFYHLGNVTLPKMWMLLGDAGLGNQIILPDGSLFTAGLLTAMGIGLFFGAVGKSAQFPLHVWLPDAMEGPTPVSALIHAATMVAAGVYLVGRIFPILTPGAKLFIAIIGVTTLTMAALIAIAQTDIKRVLAYSTLSQLGYMILAMGLGSWIGGLFHLITHAFFKALLFLGSGSVIHAAHHEKEMSQYGGLIRKVPVTAVTFGIAVLAMTGFSIAGWGFSGFYSKDMILAHAGAFGYLTQEAGKSQAYWLFFYLPTIVAYITAFYMTRCWMLTFWGKPRNQHVYDHAREQPIMWIPLVALAVMSIIAGKYLGVSELLQSAIKESNNYCSAVVHDFHGFGTAWAPEITATEGASTGAADLLERGNHLVHSWLGWAWLVGIGLGVIIYWKGYWIAGPLMRIAPLNWIRIWLYRRMYFDELYFSVFVSIVMALSWLSATFDKHIVDGIVNLVGATIKRTAFLAGWNDRYIVDGAVNGVATLSHELGAAVCAPQTGRIRIYMTVLMVAIGLSLAGAIIVVLSR